MDLTCIGCSLGQLPQNDVLDHVGELSFLWLVCRGESGRFHEVSDEDVQACWLIAATASILHIPKIIWTSWEADLIDTEWRNVMRNDSLVLLHLVDRVKHLAYTANDMDIMSLSSSLQNVMTNDTLV